MPLFLFHSFSFSFSPVSTITGDLGVPPPFRTIFYFIPHLTIWIEIIQTNLLLLVSSSLLIDSDNLGVGLNPWKDQLLLDLRVEPTLRKVIHPDYHPNIILTGLNAAL